MGKVQLSCRIAALQQDGGDLLALKRRYPELFTPVSDGLEANAACRSWLFLEYYEKTLHPLPCSGSLSAWHLVGWQHEDDFVRPLTN